MSFTVEEVNKYIPFYTQNNRVWSIEDGNLVCRNSKTKKIDAFYEQIGCDIHAAAINEITSTFDAHVIEQNAFGLKPTEKNPIQYGIVNFIERIKKCS